MDYRIRKMPLAHGAVVHDLEISASSSSWPPLKWKPITITAKELVAIIFSCSVWGRFLNRKRVQLFCDNLGLVEPIRKGASKDNIMMHFLRCLGFCFSQPTMTFTSQFHTFQESKTRQQTCCQETSFNNSSSHSQQPLAY